MVRLLLAVIALGYCAFGLGMFVTFLLFVLYGSPVTWDPVSMLIVLWPLGNAVACGFIAHGLLGLRNWGRYLVIGYNALYLAGWVFGSVATRILEPETTSTTTADAALVGVVVLLGGVSALVSSKRVRDQMIPRSAARQGHDSGPIGR